MKHFVTLRLEVRRGKILWTPSVPIEEQWLVSTCALDVGASQVDNLNSMLGEQLIGTVFCEDVLRALLVKRFDLSKHLFLKHRQDVCMLALVILDLL
jgi:hypothetical protein